MRTHMDAKVMAKALREALAQRKVEVSHGESLELVAKEFYVDFLGFNIDREHRLGDDYPLYAEISRSDVTLHLSEHHGDASPGARILVWMTGIAELHRELTDKQYRYNKPGLERDGWGQYVAVRDPFGNAVVFRERAQ